LLWGQWLRALAWNSEAKDGFTIFASNLFGRIRKFFGNRLNQGGAGFIGG
jgi:hypothetical protein